MSFLPRTIALPDNGPTIEFTGHKGWIVWHALEQDVPITAMYMEWVEPSADHARDIP